MRTIAHISDLHFGRVDAGLLEPLVSAIDALAPDVVAVSGDLTQRARDHEFRAAAEFLERLRFPKIIVPGNHDIPLFNLVARFAQPLDGYLKHITPDLAPWYADAELVVFGVNTARSLTWKGGRINAEQIEAARARLCELPDEVVKVMVTHHPFDVGEGRERDMVGRADLAVTALAHCGIDILLSGHLHQAAVGTTADRFCIAGHAALIVQAGTTLSERTRKEVNSFNVLRTEASSISVQRYLWDVAARNFVAQPPHEFRRSGAVWETAPGP
ncbi:MAG: metallophosphoesterase [Pseudomonadota bacterium]|nr:metallophosphoesterase [Pseudomonadota bacterium]